MRTTTTPSMLTTSERVYQRLLWLYPADYRREYGPDMMHLFRDLQRDALRQHGTTGLATLWMRVIVDFVTSLVAEYRRLGARMSRTSYAQSSGSLLMLVGSLFALGSFSQLQPGSHYTFHGVYLVSFIAFLSAVLLIPVGVLSFLALVAPYENTAAKGALWIAALGVPVGLFSAMMIEAIEHWNDEAWYVSVVGVLAHLMGMGLYGVATNRLRTRTSWRLLPIAIAVIPFAIFFSDANNAHGPLYVDFAALMLLGLSWCLLARSAATISTDSDHTAA